MHLSSKTRIGIRALYDIAFHGRGRQSQAKDIALRQRIPVRSLEEVLQDLRKAGLIDAQRGPRGGYVLARPAEEIAVSQIVRALDGPVERLFSLDQPASPRRRGRPRRSAGSAGATDAAPGLSRATTRSVSLATARSVAKPSEVTADVPALVWTDVAGRIAAVLGETTLGDFIRRAESTGVIRASADAPMYFI